MLLFFFALFGVAVAFGVPHGNGQLRQWLCEADPSICSPVASDAHSMVKTYFEAFAKKLSSSYLQSDPSLPIEELLLHLQAARATTSTSAAQDPPYYGFIPWSLGHATSTAPLKVTSPACQREVKFSTAVAPTNVQVTIEGIGADPVNCTSSFFFTLGSKSTTVTFAHQQPSTLFNLTYDGSDPAALWDVEHKGVRVFENPSADPAIGFNDAVDTLLLFLPLLLNHLDNVSAVHNAYFLSNYSLMTPYTVPRGSFSTPDIPFKSGDLLAKMSLDGLGPTESFAQGTTSGHTVIVLMNETDGQWYMCESVEVGITCAESSAWYLQMSLVGAAVVWVPLHPVLSAQFNLTAAWSHVNQMLGNSYGYFNFFFGWVDTLEDNYPCLPWKFSRCLTYDVVEYVMLMLDEEVHELANTFFGQALNHRAQTGNLNGRILDALHHAAVHLGIDDGRVLMSLPEQDAWRYNSTKRGVPGHVMLPSQVCSSFACSTLRAAGVFRQQIDDEIQCTEIDVYDIFSMKIFDAAQFGSGRPSACVESDPDNTLCQLTGTWTFNLIQNVNTRPLSRNMSQHCASRNPSPYNHTGC